MRLPGQGGKPSVLSGMLPLQEGTIMRLGRGMSVSVELHHTAGHSVIKRGGALAMTLQARQSGPDILQVATGCLPGWADLFLWGAGRRIWEPRFRNADRFSDGVHFRLGDSRRAGNLSVRVAMHRHLHDAQGGLDAGSGRYVLMGLRGWGCRLSRSCWSSARTSARSSRPRAASPRSPRGWCRLFRPDQPSHEGVSFRPLRCRRAGEFVPPRRPSGLCRRLCCRRVDAFLCRGAWRIRNVARDLSSVLLISLSPAAV